MKHETENFSWLDIPKSIWYFLAEDKVKFTVSFVILTLIFLYDLLPAIFIGKMVDFFSTYKVGDSLKPFYFYIIFISTTWIIASQIRLHSKRVLGVLRSHARARVRVWGFERLTEFSLEWHNKENTGNKLQRISTGADAVVNWIKLTTKELSRIFISTIAVLIFFMFNDVKILILILTYIIIFFSISMYYGKKIYKLSNEFNTSNQSAGGTYVESANNMLAIKALGSEQGVINRVSNREQAARDVTIAKINTSNIKWRIFQFVNGITLGVFLYLVGISALAQTITVGLVIVFYNYFDRLQRHSAELDELYFDMIDHRSDLANMMPIFRETEFIKTGNDPFPKEWDKIEIKNGVMDYGSGQMGLKDFSLTLPRNSKTGVAGLSGSGKSTLAKIMLGLYSLKEGSFKIGNKDYYSISHNDAISHITVVLQETELFNLSLKENITMMRPEDPVLLERAIEISQLTNVINKLPEGVNSMIGEKGYMLSGGERQRLGIARAVYKNAPIIILDEATSSLDSETEGKIMANLLGEFGQDKTFLIIAHRLGTLKYTDNIVVMENGKIVEEGNYDALMAGTKSVFYRMNQVKETSHESAK